MADWYGFARTNYFHVKDADAFKTWAADRSLVALENNGFCGVYSEDEYGGWPTVIYDDTDPSDDRPFDLVAELAAHVVPGEIVVCIEAGAEKLRYITGQAIAFHVGDQGLETVQIGLSDIYDLAAQKWGAQPTPAEY